MLLQQLTKSLKILISCNLVLLLFVPGAYNFDPLEDGVIDRWYPTYFYLDELLFLFVAPLYLLWILYWVNKNQTIQLLLAILLLAVAAWNAFFSYLGLVMPLQDYSPYWGTALLALFFPLLLVFLILDWKTVQVIEQQEDIILDEQNL